MQGPQAVIEAGPPALTATPAAQFFFSAEGASAFACRLQGGSGAAAAAGFAACSSPMCGPRRPRPRAARGRRAAHACAHMLQRA